MNENHPKFWQQFRQRLQKTRHQWSEGISRIFLGKKEIDVDLLEQLETQLLQADVGIETTQDIIQQLTDQVSRKQLKDSSALLEALRALLLSRLQSHCPDRENVFEIFSAEDGESRQMPKVILFVGVNGAGKTTTIGKLAACFQAEGKSVMLAAGDTFRAAAVEQLQAWGKCLDIPVIAQHSGADSAAVIFDAFQAAKARNMDILLADTAGRLQTHTGLMEELKKIKRVLRKVEPTAPQEIWLVLDASIGQNSIKQAEVFHQTLTLTGLVITKLDGTAKAGSVFAIVQKLALPIRYIGLGEGIEDIQPFSAKAFVDVLLEP